MNDHLFESKENIAKSSKTLQAQQAKIKELTQVIYNQTGELDVFKVINKKIADSDLERKSIESETKEGL